MYHQPADNNQPFQHKKSLGQNFLTSPIVPGWMCDAAAVTPGDMILEIGPGTGVLTHELLARGARVIALEADRRAITHLQDKYANHLHNGQLVLQHGDARELDLSALGLKPGNFKVVANIPYYLTGQLLRHCLQTSCQPSVLVFLLQKEVADRIARAAKESILSIAVKVFGDPRYITTVSRGHFHPSPQVDSAILQVTNISLQHFDSLAATEFFFMIIHLGFGQKRKQLLGNLASTYNRSDLEHIFARHQIPMHIRAEDMTLELWLQLTQALTAIPTLSSS